MTRFGPFAKREQQPVAGARLARLRLAQAVSGALVLTYTLSTVLRADGTTSALFDGWVGNLAYASAAALCGWRALSVRSSRAGWGLLAVSLMVFTAGSVLWTTTVQFWDPVPYPSPADFCFLAFYPIAFAGIALLIRDTGPRIAGSMWTDGVIVALGVAAIGAALVIGPISRQAGSDTATVVTNLAYPVGDLVMVTVLVGFFALRGWRPGKLWWALGAALALFAVADSIYVWRVTDGTFVTGSPLDSLWAIAAFIIAVAAWHSPTERPHGGAQTQAIVIPALFMVSSLGVLLYATGNDVLPLAVVLATATLLVAITRTILSYRQLRTLADTRLEARTDDLTGMWNRRKFFEAVHDRVREAPNEPLAVLMIDLDRFKEVNDTLGHSIGDEVLRQLGPRLGSILSPDATLARLGGDEFGVLLPAADDVTETVAVAEALQAALIEPLPAGGVTLRIDASIGIALGPDHGRDADTLLQRADVAMYDAKRRRIPCSVYAADRDVHTRDRLELMEDLRNAIDHGQLVSHYQPKLDLRTGLVTGVEALVRWDHPKRGLLPPAMFLDLAEQTGVMEALTGSVLDQAVAQLAAWRREGIDLTVAVNLPASSLLDDGLPLLVHRTLVAHQMPAASLVLEITEDGLMHDPAQAHRVLERLRNLGCRLAVDDYGTGFSSLAYLRDLPVGELKLDRSFLAHVDEDPRALAIVRSTVELAHALGLRMVAEGVETQAMLDVLVDLGCDEAQGYFIARPAPAGELNLRDHRGERATVS